MDGEPFTVATVPAFGNRLHISFGVGNELHVVDLYDSNNSQHESTASIVHWGQPSAGQRRIAYDSLGVYQQLQQRGLDPLAPEAWGATLQYSKTLSAILAADGVRGDEATGEEMAALQERALWDLLSLFFLEASSGASASEQGMVAQDLARWLRTNAAAVAGSVAASPFPPLLSDQLRIAALPEAASAYWPSTARLVALGWIDDAIELLGLHSAWLRYDSAVLEISDSSAQALVGALDAATLLLRRFPVLQAPGVVHSAGRECNTPSEFATYRRTWQAQCAALAADNAMWEACRQADPATACGLRAVLAVLAGDGEALAAAAANWLELLVAQLLHIYPATRPRAELKQLAKRCFQAGSGASAPEFLQVAAALLEACTELDAQAAMRACSAYCSNWFMAHAPVLMAAHPAGASVLGAELPHAGGSQVEFYTLEYAASLMPHGPTWPLAAAYLAWCPAHGQPALEALLRALPLEAGDEWAARKGAELAQYQGLSRLAQDIWRAQGVLSWQAGMLGAALSWLAQCGDVRRADIVLQPLAAAVSSGRLSDEQSAALEALQPMLEALPPGSSNAALLAVHRLLKRGGSSSRGSGMHAAVQALAQLPVAMQDSCLRLVCHTLPVMPPGELSERDTLFLLQWLLGAEGRLRSSSKRQGEVAAEIQTARLALVRSLAASHLMQRQPAGAR